MAVATRHSRRSAVLGATEQAVGGIGIVVCLILILGVSVGWSWATTAISDTTAKVDDALAKGQVLADTASGTVDDVAGAVNTVAVSAAQLNADAAKAASLGPVLLGEIDALSSRYMQFRASYADFRQAVTTAVNRIDTLGSVVPALAISDSTLQALKDADARMQALDEQVMAVIEAKPSDVLAGIGGGVILTATQKILDGLTRVSSAVDDVQVRLAGLRDTTQTRSAQANLAVDILAVALILLLLYLAALHVVLLRAGRVTRARSGIHVVRPIGGADLELRTRDGA